MLPSIFIVNTTNAPEIRIAVREILSRRGFSGNAKEDGYEWLVVRNKEKNFSGEDRHSNNYGPEISLQELFQEYAEPIKTELTYNGYTITLMPNGDIKTSEGDLSKDRVDYFIKRRQELMKQCNLMPPTWQVETICPEISEAIQKILFKHGYAWGGLVGKTSVSFTGKKYLTMFEHDKTITYGNKQSFEQYGPLFTVQEMLQKLTVASFEDNVIDHKVVIRNDGTVDFGCLKLSKENVEEIITKRQEITS